MFMAQIGVNSLPTDMILNKRRGSALACQGARPSVSQTMGSRSLTLPVLAMTAKVSDLKGHFRLLESAHYSTKPIRLCEREMPLSRWLGPRAFLLLAVVPTLISRSKKANGQFSSIRWNRSEPWHSQRS